MNQQRAERITNPALAAFALGSALLVAINPDRALLWIAPAPLFAAVGCVLAARVSRGLRAPGATLVFGVQAGFWFGAAAYLVWLAVGTR